MTPSHRGRWIQLGNGALLLNGVAFLAALWLLPRLLTDLQSALVLEDLTDLLSRSLHRFGIGALFAVLPRALDVSSSAGSDRKRNQLRNLPCIAAVLLSLTLFALGLETLLESIREITGVVPRGPIS